MENGATGAVIDFDTWCEITARMFERTPEEQLAILEDRGVSEDAWLDAGTRWQQALSEDSRARRHERPERYGAAFDAELRRRGLVALSPAERGAAAPAPPPAAEGAGAAPAGPAPMTAAWLSNRAAETGEAAPGDTQSAAPVEAAPGDTQSAAPVEAAPARAAGADPPSFARPVAPEAGAPAPAPVTGVAPPPPPPPPIAEETLHLGGRAAPSAPLPFDPAAAPRWPVHASGAQPPGSAPGPAPARAMAPGEETMGPGAISPVARSVLPFSGVPGGPAASGPAPAPQPPAGNAPAGQPLSSRGGSPAPVVGEETIQAGAVSPAAIRSLPFSVAPAGEPRSGQGSSGQGGSGQGSSGPAEAAGAPSGQRLTLEQLAGLSAELSMYPDRGPQILARWGMTEAAHKAELSAWAASFRADPALYGRFRAACEHYRAWAERSRGR